MQAEVTLSLGAKWGWVFNAAPRPLHPPETARYKLYTRLIRPQRRV